MNGRRLFVGMLLLGVLWSSCATRVGPEALGAAVRRHTDIGLNHVYYMGSRGEDHYLLHQFSSGSTVYRVSDREVVIEPRFGYTRDAEAWRLLAARWWPVQVPGEPLVFREEAGGTGGAAGTVRMTPVKAGE
jgi:hypothetical protein